MGELVKADMSFDDVAMIKLAREVAMDILPFEEVLATHGLTQERWDELNNHPAFQSLLKSAIEEWQSATNTAERVKIKSLAFIEESLPEFYARAHDPKEPLSAKTEVLKTIAKFAGVGNTNFDGSVNGERMTVTINLGEDRQLRIEKDITPRDEEDMNG